MDTTLRDQACALMKQRRFDQAIEAFDRHLADEPEDLRSLLQCGICHLLRGSESLFLAIHDRAGRLIEAAGQVPAEAGRLWQQYRALVLKVTAAALVLGTVDFASAQSAHKYSGGVMIRPRPETTQPAPPTSSHRYSGGVYVRPTTRPATRPISAHRYSGGVFVAPMPEKLPPPPPARE